MVVSRFCKYYWTSITKFYLWKHPKASCSNNQVTVNTLVGWNTILVFIFFYFCHSAWAKRFSQTSVQFSRLLPWPLLMFSRFPAIVLPPNLTLILSTDHSWSCGTARWPKAFHQVSLFICWFILDSFFQVIKLGRSSGNSIPLVWTIWESLAAGHCHSLLLQYLL